jgi:3-hydroxybutyrate dehydrogenase
MNQHQTILVTGSERGLGRTIAEDLARAGRQVAFHGLADQPSEELSAVLEQHPTARYYAADLSNEPEATALIDRVRSKQGRISGLVNNAGIQHVSPIEEFSTDWWNRVIAINLTACFVLARSCFSDMKEAGFGRIVNVSSVHGLRASPYKAAYVSAKHGLIGLTKVLALEGAGFGVTANAICPGYVKTPLVEAQIRDQARSHGIDESRVIEEVILKKQPIKEFVNAESIAESTRFLLSEGAGQVSGTEIVLDGAWTSQ